MTREEFVSKFKEGDKVRVPEFSAEEFCEIKYIGSKYFFCEDESGVEWSFELSDNWQLYQEPKKKVKYYQYIVKNKEGVVNVMYTLYKSKEECKLYLNFKSKIIGVANEIEVDE